MMNFFELHNIVACLSSIFLGTLIGVLPSISPSIAIALSLPILSSYSDPTISLIFLTGILFGSQYGGSTSAILLNIPGESTSIMTSIDGYTLTNQGKSKLALYTAAISSFIGSMVALGVFVLGISVIGELNDHLSAPDFLIILLFGCYCIVTLTDSNKLHNFQGLILGFILSYIGEDNFGIYRYTFFPGMEDGLSVMMLTIGMFGLTETILNRRNYRNDFKQENNNFTFSELRGIIPVSIRSSFVASILGVIPFFSGVTIDMICYNIEKKFFNKEGSIGNGDIRGVAAAESANNALMQSSLIPLLSLGIPSNNMTTMVYVALVSCGISFNTNFSVTYSSLYETFICFILVANILLLLLNSYAIDLWIKILRIPITIINPIIIIFGLTLVYSNNNNLTSLFMLICMCLLGILFRYYNSSYLPTIIGFILGKHIEDYTYRTIKLFNGKWEQLLHQPMVIVLFFSLYITLCVCLYNKFIKKG